MVSIGNTFWNILNIFHYNNFNKWMYTCSCWNNYDLFLLYLLPIPLQLWFRTEIIRCTNFPITNSVFLSLTCLWDILHHLKAQFCCICCIHDIIFKVLKHWGHIITDATENNLLNGLKILTSCTLILKSYGILVFRSA